MIPYVRTHFEDLLDDIREQGRLDDELRARVETALQRFHDQFAD